MTLESLVVYKILEDGTRAVAGINFTAVGTMLVPLIVAVTAIIKTVFPALTKKAWIPVTLGILSYLAIGLSAGTITTWLDLLNYIISGVATGGIASSMRNIWKGK